MYGVWTYCPKCHRDIAAPDRDLLRMAVREHECPGSSAREPDPAPLGWRSAPTEAEPDHIERIPGLNDPPP